MYPDFFTLDFVPIKKKKDLMVSLNTDIPQAHASRSCGSCLKTIAVLAKPSKHSCKYYIGLLSNKCFIFIPSFMVVCFML